jgi:hypothetical protein
MKNYVDLVENGDERLMRADDGLGFRKNWGRTSRED